MKKIFFIIPIIVALFSCSREELPIPVSAFSYTAQNVCTVPSQISFENLSLYGSIYRWDFGDGSPVIFEKNPVHTFSSEGIYTVDLTAYGNGGMHSEQKLIYVVKAPQIDFSASDTAISVSGSVTFTGITTSGVLPSTWFWTFGDGSTSTLQNSTHIYNAPGIYDVTLTGVNACGSTFVEKKKLIKVNAVGSAPVVNFIANNITITAGQTVNFTDLTVNTPTSWNWTFIGGNPTNSTIQNPGNIQYNTPGDYDVSLSASNSFGSNSLTKTTYIHVLNAAPTLVFIKKITVKQMGFPPPPQTVNLYYKLTDFSSTVYLNGLSQIMNNITQANLPIVWNINPIYQVPIINHPYKIELWDKKMMPPVENLAGSVQFNIYNFTNNGTTYPTTINIIQTPFNVEVELQWQ